MISRYCLPTEIVFGSGSLGQIAGLVSKYLPQKILLVTGKGAMKRLGITERVVNYLKEYKVTIYDKVEVNPGIEEVEEAREFLKSEKAGLIISLGGGSVLDAGKAISILANSDHRLRDYLAGKEQLQKGGIPFIAVPTTSGTGSEVTGWATIWDKEEKRKYSLSNRHMYPDVALVDPELTLKLPPKTTATTGLDALCHAIEAYWSNNSQPFSSLFAREAIRLVSLNLQKAYDHPEELRYREVMSLASLLAGMAFSNTRTTAAHSISYPLTARFGIAHGLACAVTLPQLLIFNSPAIGRKALDIISLLGAREIEEGADKIKKLMRGVGLPTTLSEMGIKKEDIPKIIEEGFTPDRTEHNPRRITRDDLYRILEEIL